MLALLLAPLAVIWFGSLGMRSLISPDEGRYASIAWEMMRSGDWITPRLNGLLYFEKPPMQYWLSALFLHLFGLNEFAARLWPALAGFLTVLAVGATASRLWGRETGIRTLAIAASMTWVFGNASFPDPRRRPDAVPHDRAVRRPDRRERSRDTRGAPQLDLAPHGPRWPARCSARGWSGS